MRINRLCCAAAVALAAPAFVLAQPASAPGPGPGPAASAPRGGMGPGGRMRWNADNTPGWRMMSAEERRAHHAAMAKLQTHDECVAYLDKHRAQMAERARQQGRPAVPTPRRDPCGAWKK